MTKQIRRSPDSSERLLKAAAKLFREKGFAATTVREIAAAAKVLPGSLHYRYPTKEALLLKLMDDAVERAISTVMRAVETSRDPAERLRLAIRSHLLLLLSGDDSIYVLLYEWRSLGEAAREIVERLRSRYEAFWDGLLYEAAGAGYFRSNLDLKLVRQMGFGALNWVVQWYRPDLGRTPEEIADAFWAFLSFGVVEDDRRPGNLAGLLSLLKQLSPAAPADKGLERG